MPQNIEIKAKIDDPVAFHKTSQAISGSEGIVIPQTDTFFNAPNGRLKLRELQGEKAQLVFYSRSDESGPKCSDYHISQVDNPSELMETLRRCLGTKGVVKKVRTLYMVGQTRVHVDKVEGLGDFMELEVVLQSGQSLKEGEQIAEDLMEKLGVKKSHLITGAYMDLINKNKEHSDIAA